MTNATVIGAGMAKAQEASTLLGRISAFFAAAMDAESTDRSAAAFLVTSVLEAQRHPRSGDRGTRRPAQLARFRVSWAVNDAIEHGRLQHRHRHPLWRCSWL